MAWGRVSPARFCLFFVIARSVGAGYFLSHQHPDPFAQPGRTFLLCSLMAYVLDGLGWILWHSSLPMAMMAGGDAAVIVATRYGPVSVVAPLTAASPVVTIAFARLVLKERITPVQYFRIGSTLVGMVLTL
ncbi:MAG: hypothetical protein AMXMBFR33_32080 [Candidatus Xenobia bacterium]